MGRSSHKGAPQVTIKYALAAALSLAIFQPASAATIFDYNVYANGHAGISGGSYGKIASGSFNNENGSTGTNYESREASSSDLGASASSLSAQLKGLAPTGTMTSAQWKPGQATLTGTSTGINVFNIDGSDGTAPWSVIYNLTFSGPGTGAIVNVAGTSLSSHITFNFGGLAADQVIFNFYEANSVSMGGMNINGSILAPSALVTLNGGSVLGSVIADSFSSAGTTIGGQGFSGYAPSAGAVPEPSTWAMLILGFGAVGAAMRRRRLATVTTRLRLA